LHDQGHLEDAAASHQRAIEIDPECAEAHTNLGNTWRELGRLEDATAAHEKALAIRPDFAKALNNLGVVQMAVTRFSIADQIEEALASLDRALTLEPDYPAAHSNMGVALMELGRCEESIASFRRAIELRTQYAEAHSNLGHLQLLMGDYRNGWVGCNWRWGSYKFISPRRQYEKPQWAGETIGGKRLLIWSEQGIGDEIVHAGMVPDLIARGA
jgi:Flp pilus assembly protein TadD